MQRLNLKSFLRPHESANNPETLRMWPSTCLRPSIDKFRESAWVGHGTAEISGATRTRRDGKKIVRSEVNYRDCEELDKGPGGLLFFSHNPR